MAGEAEQQLRAYVEYLRDMGIHDFYRQGEPVYVEAVSAEFAEPAVVAPAAAAVAPVAAVIRPKPVQVAVETDDDASRRPEFLEPAIPKLVSFDGLAPLPEVRVPLAQRAEALAAIRADIGDCTRCPLAYAGRRKIVFGDGDAGARLMFVGEGPGADEDASGLPFVGKAGQLLNNMIQAMGLRREDVYIANIVKCRPPGNRVPEPVEANTCDQFLLRQIDVVQPQVVVALGATAATYLLGVKQSLSTLRRRWHSCRGAKLAVTYHPAFLLRDPGQKGEAWKDLQMVMAELGLKAPAKG
jgi:uracil-DNA glycosylase